MQPVVLPNICARLSFTELLVQLRVIEGSEEEAQLRKLVCEAESIAVPKALCGVSYIDERGSDYVVLDGVRFSSRALASSLAETHRAFPYIATCGRELEIWSQDLASPLHRYWSEAIREAAVRNAMAAIVDYIEDTYKPGDTSRVTPGLLNDWPLNEQQLLFQLLGDTETTVGVHLDDSMLMVPPKTESGLRFGAAGSFESCMLCPQSTCPIRRSPYNPALYLYNISCHRKRTP